MKRRDMVRMLAGGVSGAYLSPLLRHISATTSQTAGLPAPLRAGASLAKNNEVPYRWLSSPWEVSLNQAGLIVQLRNGSDPFNMNWVRPDETWGAGMSRVDGKLKNWDPPIAVHHQGNALSLLYKQQNLTVAVRRSLEVDGCLHETYTFLNTDKLPLLFHEGDIGFRIPLPDNYPDARTCIHERANTHIWMGGHTSYICAIRMGGHGPHLGMVLDRGQLTAYSITDRPWDSNDRGIFVLHPGEFQLRPGDSMTVGWTCFWHEGWDAFFLKALKQPGFIRLSANHYSVLRGESITVHIEGSHLTGNTALLLDGAPVVVDRRGAHLTATITPETIGEHLVEYKDGSRSTVLRALVTEDLLELCKARATFIVRHQQRSDQSSPLNGAYLIYDNEARQQVCDGDAPDHNAARERVGMGVLVALYLPYCDDAALKMELRNSVDRYWQFVIRELQSEDGTVFDGVGNDDQRLYNYPWVAHLHLAMFQNTREPQYCDWFLKTIRSFYRRGGEHFYCIGLPILESLLMLKSAGYDREHDEILSLYRLHADALLKNGTAFPRHEVNYEQSIVAPAVQIITEVFLATKDRRYLDGLPSILACLNAFNGHQPDFHLNDIAIRHWDDFWFGKRRLYGDTFPHYWSTITAVCFDGLFRATGDSRFRERALNILANNRYLFSEDGEGCCAYVYPLSINDRRGSFRDPWANDQDWALVHELLLRRRDENWQSARDECSLQNRESST
ncbi:MAG: hypothetical protein WA634_19155 [Silvibacterium sp.]